MSLTLMNFKELQYWNKNNYIKSEVNRKLYANKTEKKLYFEKEFDEDEAHEAAIANKKILQMIFPTFNLNLKEDEEEDHNKMITQKKSNNDPNESLDFKREYEKLNFETTNKKEEPPQRQTVPTSNSNIKPPPPPIAPQETTSNYRQPPPPPPENDP